MDFVIQLIGMPMKLGVIMIFAPLFVLPGVFVSLLVIVLGRTYLKAQTSAKHEARQVLNHLTISHRLYLPRESFVAMRVRLCFHISVQPWTGLVNTFLLIEVLFIIYHSFHSSLRCSSRFQRRIAEANR